MLRIRSILARAAARETDGSSTGSAPSFDPATGVLMHSSGRNHITTAEQKLLASFASRPDTVLSRDDIATAMDSGMRGRSIDVAVARLRAKIEPDPRTPSISRPSGTRDGFCARTIRPGMNATS